MIERIDALMLQFNKDIIVRYTVTTQFLKDSRIYFHTKTYVDIFKLSLEKITRE